MPTLFTSGTVLRWAYLSVYTPPHLEGLSRQDKLQALEVGIDVALSLFQGKGIVSARRIYVNLGTDKDNDAKDGAVLAATIGT